MEHLKGFLLSTFLVKNFIDHFFQEFIKSKKLESIIVTG